MKTVDLFGLAVCAEPLETVHRWIRDRLESGEMTIIVTPNPEILLKADHDPEFLKILQSADMSIPDGTGLLVAADVLRPCRQHGWMMSWGVAIGRIIGAYAKRLYGGRSPIPERIAGSDLTTWMIELCANTGYSVGLLGGAPGVGEGAVAQIKKKFPTLTVVSHQGGRGSTEEDVDLRTWATREQIDVLFVAYGAPKQEQWMRRNALHLPSVRLMMGVGGTIDFLAGTKKRAPRWMRAIGIEWVFRVIQEPTRIVRIWNAVVRWTSLVSVRAARIIHQTGISG